MLGIHVIPLGTMGTEVNQHHSRRSAAGSDGQQLSALRAKSGKSRGLAPADRRVLSLRSP